MSDRSTPSNRQQESQSTASATDGNSLKLLIPLLIAAGILLGGNGLQGTLIALRGAEEGFSAALIGIMGTAYFGGFMVGCVAVPALLREVGHIRTFSALAAIAASGTLVLVLIVDPLAWILLRLVMGFCFAGLFTTVESWLNAGASNANRGRLLSLYRLIDLAAVTGSQFLLPLFGPSGFTLFALLAIFTAMSLVPVSLGDRSRPRAPAQFEFRLGKLWHLSPIACIGCVSIGLTNSAFRLVGPLYAQDIGLSVTGVATFMSAGIVGGAALQYPLGMLSDRGDRRVALMLATAGATLSGLFITLFAGTSPWLNYAGIFCFGAFALPLYSLSAAHANDHAGENDYVMVAAGLTFFFSLGAMIGPTAASLLINQFGPQALFSYTSVVHASLIVLTLWRMQIRAAVPLHARKGFVTLLRTSPVIFNLAQKRPRQGKRRGQSSSKIDSQ